jgi:stage II sporulation protein D
MEVQKVQVVAFRSYAINCILKARQNNGTYKPYDIKRTNFHQTYNGMHNYTHLKQAIEETKDLILTYNGNVILAMFDACCGGIVPAKMNSLEFKKTPYLARKYPCSFCKKYKLYQWHREIDIKDFTKKLKNNPKISQKICEAGKILNIKTKEKDQAGIVRQVKVFCSRKSIKLSGNDLWESMRDKIKSLNFDIKKRKNKIIIDGKGFGHQIGLCQHGARELVRLGWNFKRILRFYYPETKFAKLKHAKI